MTWKCKKCGSKNIEVGVIIDPFHIYLVDKNGKPSTLSSKCYSSLDEVVREEGEIQSYFCDNCESNSTKIENIADWSDD